MLHKQDKQESTDQQTDDLQNPISVKPNACNEAGNEPNEQVELGLIKPFCILLPFEVDHCLDS